MNTVGYLGPKSSFTEQAVKRVFIHNKRIAFESIFDCLDAVKNEEVDFGVVPLENTIEGSVTITLDYLIHEQSLPIVAEIIVPIQQHLMIHPNNESNEIKSIYSHPHALAQCRKFLYNHYPSVDQIQSLSTSGAAQFVANNPEIPIAAIANELAAEEYHLTVVDQNIHDYEINHTRFIVVCKKGREQELSISKEVSTKTTLIVTLPSDQAGALHQVLSAFAWRKINLSKIESRPMKTGLGRYLFIIDLEGTIESILITSAIHELEALGCGVVCLGSYPIIQK
ncbi:prephenate dehydratase [Bacillus suaedaesalsae]|uniref:Prephenate dehydratase n=1 Tax=Bacillus suaedaesalsae TaxID=2810349 RepID=A0ABS2DMK2_9BACI|nr:prephenate dehydratase [Bacillus suaedaesalsae]MBM6619734.1 prephenate dehydratase [Bacillus suaedaesalsae]